MPNSGIKERALEVLIFILTTILLFLVLLLVSPFYLWRLSVKILGKCSRRLGPMLPSLETFFLAIVEPDLEREPEAVPTAVLTAQGHMDLHDFRLNFARDILNAGRSYDRLKQHPVSWLGFPFYEWDSNFSIDDHVRLLPHGFSAWTQRSSCDLVTRFIRKPFKPSTSPWEFLLFHFTEEGLPKTYAMMRMHHTLGDGRSLRRILNRMVGGWPDPQPKKKTSSMTEALKSWYDFTVPLPRLFFQESPKISRPSGGFHEAVPRQAYEEPLTSQTDQFPLQLIKGLKKEFGFSFTVVVSTAVAKGLRYLNKIKGSTDSACSDDFEVHGNIAIPRNGLPGQDMANYFYLTKHSLLARDGPIRDRLQQHKDHLEASNMSARQFAVAQNTVLNLTCSLPLFLARTFGPTSRLPFMISNMAGPSQTVALWSACPVSDIMYFIPDARFFGVGVSVHSYNGSVRIGLCADKLLVGSQADLDHVAEVIQKDITEALSLILV